METRTVRDVMTTTVVVADPDTTYKEIVDILAGHAVSALPVVDPERRVHGVVSEADLLHRLEFAAGDPHARLFDRRRRGDRAKASADTARELMTSPAVTIRPDATVGEAARLMERERVKRLPVVDDDGRLVGVVSRRDLLRTYQRPDPEIQREVRNEVVWRMLLTEPAQVDVTVADGVVTLAGTVDRRSTAEIAARLTRAVAGVIAVRDELTWEYDDTEEVRKRYVFDAQVPPTIRWP